MIWVGIIIHPSYYFIPLALRSKNVRSVPKSDAEQELRNWGPRHNKTWPSQPQFLLLRKLE